jgi:hypothetical protein
MEGQKKGFTFMVNQGQIGEYRSWTVDRRLQMRKSLSKRTGEFQEALRKGKI